MPSVSARMRCGWSGVRPARREWRPSLSPAGLRSGRRFARLLLPSPNGSTICAVLQGQGATVVAACLRNAHAVGCWVAERLADGSARSAVIVPAGERWADGTMRPAVEDLLGAGAVLDAMLDNPEHPAEATLSPEAMLARDAARPGQGLADLVRGSVSGRELIERGFDDDVEIALERSTSGHVPILVDGVFRPASPLS